MYILLLSILISGCSTLASSPYEQQPPAIPISYSYGGYPRIQTNITWGIPAQEFVPTIFDTGSIAFWTYGPNATINDGSQYHFTQGPCNKSVKTFFNWPVSRTHSSLQVFNESRVYSYGGNGKIVVAYNSINDTLSFTNTDWPGLSNQEVALSNFTIVTQYDTNCAIPEATFDHSILGLAPFGAGDSAVANIGPSFRENLFNEAKVQSRSFSMWFDKAPQSVTGEYIGTAVFGAVPSRSKYSGQLVRLKQDPPDDAYVGYYVTIPQMSVTSFSYLSKQTIINNTDTTVTQCLLDSGTGQDELPFDQDQVTAVTGLLQYTEDDYDLLAWNGTCDSIPATATLDFTFAGETGKKVTIAVPIRSYARGIDDELPGFPSHKLCGLSLTLSNPGSCIFGAPFFTAAFMVFNDDMNQVALAQGGVSVGSTEGLSSLGPLTIIRQGQDVPGSI